jgi:hypothetical protein
MKTFGRYRVMGPLTKTAAGERFLAQTFDGGGGGGEYHVVRELEYSAFDDARRAAWLRHPNLISIRELGEQAGGWYVATEYVHGEALGRVLARVRRTHDQVPIAMVTAIGAAAAAGLHHAHTHSGSRRTLRGSIHGRLAPSSIVIGYDGTVKVGDLGIGPGADASYLAPEQVSGTPIDRRTDVFALGIVLYEMATARRLFRAPSDILTKAAIEHANIPPPSRFRRDLPRALENIILKALAPVPSARFKSAGELRAALQAFAQRLGMRPSPAGIADYLKKLFGTRPLPWLPATRAAAHTALEEIEDDLDAHEQLGVAAPPDWVLRELGVPEARALEATPPRGTKTPMSWTSQTVQAQPWTLRRIGIMASAAIGATIASAIAGYLFVGAVAGSGDAPAVMPMSAPAPPPPSSASLGPASLPPAPPPPASVPPAPPASPAASPDAATALAPAAGSGTQAAVRQPKPKRAAAKRHARPQRLW